MKPLLTDEQKKSFERQFKKIVEGSNSTAAKNLLKKSGEIKWVVNVPLTGDIIDVMEATDANSVSDYLKLLKKIDDRTI